jgi:hypothetical protein
MVVMKTKRGKNQCPRYLSVWAIDWARRKGRKIAKSVASVFEDSE